MTAGTDPTTLDKLTEAETSKLVLKDNKRTAYLIGGPNYFVSHIDDDSPGPAKKPISRETAEQMVDAWEIDGLEDIGGVVDVPDWVREYQTTTFRGPRLYPVPEGWVLSDVEGGAIAWKRYEGGEAASDAESPNDIPDEIRADGPTDEAVLFSEWNEHDETLNRLTFNYEETAFEDVIVMNEEELWEKTAAALATYAHGDGVPEISFASGKPPKPVREKQRQERKREQRKERNHALDDFA